MKYLRELAAGNVLNVLGVLGVLYILQQLHRTGVLPLAIALFAVGMVADWAWDEVR